MLSAALINKSIVTGECPRSLTIWITSSKAALRKEQGWSEFPMAVQENREAFWNKISDHLEKREKIYKYVVRGGVLWLIGTIIAIIAVILA